MKYSKEFKLQLGMSEAATDAEVDAHLTELQTAGNRAKSLETELAKERSDRQEAEKRADADKAKIAANAKVDAWLHDGRISGNATEKVRSFYVALAAGDNVTAVQFEGVIDSLPKFDTTRVAGDVKPPTDHHAAVIAEDFKRAAKDPEASRRIMGVVAHRRANGSPNFTASDLEREVLAAAKK